MKGGGQTVEGIDWTKELEDSIITGPKDQSFKRQKGERSGGPEVKMNEYSRILRSRISEDLRTQERELKTEHQMSKTRD